MSLIKMANIKKEYSLGQSIVHALRGVELEIEKEEFTAIWGPSGSGKTTLLNIIGTIDDASSGDYYFNDKKFINVSDNKKSIFRNKEIGFIFQTFNLIPVLSALENVMLPLQVLGMDLKTAKEKALLRLDDVELENFVHHRPDKMSGGQRQRVAIARALVANPSLVLADEPTANLDTKTSDLIISIMKKINKRDKTTFIFSTHDQRLLDQMGRLIKLEDGIVIEQ